MSEPKTVRAKIAVAVDPDGEWNACGWGPRERHESDQAMALACDTVGTGEARYWIEVDLPVPAPAERTVEDGVTVTREEPAP